MSQRKQENPRGGVEIRESKNYVILVTKIGNNLNIHHCGTQQIWSSQNGILKYQVTAQLRLLHHVCIFTEGCLKAVHENVTSGALRMVEFREIFTLFFPLVCAFRYFQTSIDHFKNKKMYKVIFTLKNKIIRKALKWFQRLWTTRR